MTSNVGETIIRRIITEHGSRNIAGDFSVKGANTDTYRKLSDQHENEKRNLQTLNQKFGVYLDRVKVLETNNQQLQAKLDHIKEIWGKLRKKIKIVSIHLPYFV